MAAAAAAGGPAAPPRSAGPTGVPTGPLWKQLGEPNLVGRAVQEGGGRKGVVWLRATVDADGGGGGNNRAATQRPGSGDLFWLAWRDEGSGKWTYECPPAEAAPQSGGAGAGSGAPDEAAVAAAAFCAGAGPNTTTRGGTEVTRVVKPGLPYVAVERKLTHRFADHPFATHFLRSVLLPAQQGGWQPQGGSGNGGAAAAMGAVLTSPARALGRLGNYIGGLIPGAASGAGASGAAAAAAAAGGQETTSPELGRGSGRRGSGAAPPLALQRATRGSAGKASVKAPKTAEGGRRATRGGGVAKPAAAKAAAAAAKQKKKPAPAVAKKQAAPPPASKKRPAACEAGAGDDEEEEDETEDVQATEQISADPEATRTDTDEDDEGGDADDRGTEDEAVVPSPTRGGGGGSSPTSKRARPSPAAAAAARVHPKYSKVKGKAVSFRPEYADRVTGKKWPPHLCRADGDRAVDEYGKAAFPDDATFEIERFVATRAMRQRRPGGTPSKTPTRYVLVKWKGYELDVGDASGRNNGGWERLEALRQGGGREAADEAWEEFDRKGGREQALAEAEALKEGALPDSSVAWLQAAAPVSAKKGAAKNK